MNNHRQALTILSQARDCLKDPASRAEIEPEVNQAVLDTMLERIEGSIIDAQTALNENMVNSSSQITR